MKLEEVDKENKFLRGEVKDFTVLLNEKIQTSSRNFKTYERMLVTRKVSYRITFPI